MITVIPAIDIINGTCVRLSQGRFSQVSTYGDPLETAKMLAGQGFRRLHLVDLDGARFGKLMHLDVLEMIATHTSLIIDYSGGITTTADLAAVFNAGAAIAGTGSIAARQPELLRNWLGSYGPEKIWLGADVRNRQLATHGWQEQTGLDIFEFLDARQQDGITHLFCTDIAKDGMLSGPATELYHELCTTFPGLSIIASGGVSSVQDIAALETGGCKGVIVGRALYEGKISFDELLKYLS